VHGVKPLGSKSSSGTESNLTALEFKASLPAVPYHGVRWLSTNARDLYSGCTWFETRLCLLLP
jgi:hypothetical protein